MPQAVHFIGIGGIGMSALARFFDSRGVRVSGYDRTQSALTKELEVAGVNIHYEDDPSLAPKDVQLVVYTPAVPPDHRELEFYRSAGYPVLKRSEVLQLVTRSSFNICVAGTHGKTTITTMIAHLLRHSGYGCTAFLGGISVNYDTNYWGSDNNVFVLEADEYDRSFLKLDPDVAVVSAMDPDHLDVYGTAEAMEEAFLEFSRRIRSSGMLVSKFGLARSRELVAGRHLRYSLQNDSADAFAANIRMESGTYEFDVQVGNETIENLKLNMGGMHNVENAVAAVTVASSLEIDPEKIRDALDSFRGVRRRFEYVIPPGSRKLVFVDDYAHHPEELRALISGARSLFRQYRCTIIFQPHLYTRTRDLAVGFAAALDLADEAVLLPIYPARELPIGGVSSEMICDRMERAKVTVKTKPELMEWLRTEYMKGMNPEFGDLLITAGAGDIDLLVDPIREILRTA